MSLTSFIINLAVKNEPIESFDNYLFVSPHPDDLEIGCGATIAKLIALGKKITYVVCLDGRFGKEFAPDGITCDDLVKLRYQETLNACKVLGVTDVRFLGLSDGNQYTYKDLLNKVAEVINDVKPDIIFGPDPNVNSECHADHINVGNVCKELANFANYPEIFVNYLPKGIVPSNDIKVKAIALYYTAKPNKFVRTNKYFKVQKEALKAYQSQFPEGHVATKAMLAYLTVRSIDFGMRCFSFRAEGFRMMNNTRMHVIAEGSK